MDDEFKRGILEHAGYRCQCTHHLMNDDSRCNNKVNMKSRLVKNRLATYDEMYHEEDFRFFCKICLAKNHHSHSW
jgi:hypothetical protein